MTQSTILSTGPINASGDVISVELHQPADNPSVIMIRWREAPTLTAPSRLKCGSRRSHEELGVRQHPIRPDPGSTAVLIGGWRHWHIPTMRWPKRISPACLPD